MMEENDEPLRGADRFEPFDEVVTHTAEALTQEGFSLSTDDRHLGHVEMQD